MTDSIDIEGLRVAAENAAPGPWHNGFDDCEVVYTLAAGEGNVVCLPPEYNMEASLGWWATNSAFIALANPQTILALLSRIEGVERENEELKSKHRADMREATKAVGETARIQGLTAFHRDHLAEAVRAIRAWDVATATDWNRRWPQWIRVKNIKEICDDVLSTITTGGGEND